MIGFMTRVLVLIFGYAYLSYQCFKTVELNKPDIEQLRFWCQYWILVAGLTVSERITDVVIGWLPMYCEAKLAFFIYLWYPKTKGTGYVYGSYFRPYVSKHEPKIDRNLLELRARAADMALLCWQKAASSLQTTIFDVMQFVISKSIPSQAAQPQQQGTTQKTTAPPNPKSASKPQPQNDQPSSPTSLTTSSSEDTAEEEAGASEDPKRAPATAAQKTTPTLAVVLSSKTSDSKDEQVMQGDSVLDSANEDNAQSPQQLDVVLGDLKRVTRARSRITRATSNNRSS